MPGCYNLYPFERKKWGEVPLFLCVKFFFILAAFFAGEHGAWASHASVPKRELARPKGRSPVSATDLARAGVAAAPTKKVAKITNTS